MLRRSLAALVILSLTVASSAALAKKVVAPAAPTPPPPGEPPLEEHLASARAAGKPLVIDFYTDWCGPCRMFEQKILPVASVQAALGDVVFVRYDAEKGNGLTAAARYRVDAYPTFVVVDGQGKLVTRSSGTPDEPTPFVSFVDRAVALSLDEATIRARLADKKSDARALLGAARWLAAHQRLDEASATYARAVRGDRGGKLGIAPTAEWEAFAIEHSRAYLKRVAEDAAAFAERWPASAQASDAALVAIRSGQLPAARARKLWAIVLKQSWDAAPALNGLAYTALAVGDNDAALQAAERAVALTPKDASVYDTLAEVHHYRGEKDQALAASDQSIALADPNMAAALKPNHDRFAQGGGAKLPGPDVEAEKARGAKELADFVHDDGTPEGAGEGDATPSAAEQAKIESEQAMRAQQRKVNDALRGAGGKCSAQAGSLAEAWVRIEFAPAGGKPAKVLVLEPGVSAGLRKCLLDSLGQAVFPVAPAAANGRATGAVKLQTGVPAQK
jgi:thiol-disulfide isomerase/thioredoxin